MIIFKTFQGLEISTLNFKDFPDFYMISTNPEDRESGRQVQIASYIMNRR